MLKISLKQAALAASMLMIAVPAFAAKSAQDTRKEKVAQIPTCTKPLGTISVIEPEDVVNWWTGQQLPAPSRLIMVFVN